MASAQSNNSKITGIWQVDNPTIGDAYLNNYRFFPDGTFKYEFNNYDDRGRIIAAKGSFKLKDSVLTLIIKTRTEIIGGDLVEGNPGFQQEELVLEGGKEIEVKQKITTPIVLILHWFTRKKVLGFKLGNNTYYKISSNPKE